MQFLIGNLPRRIVRARYFSVCAILLTFVFGGTPLVVAQDGKADFTLSISGPKSISKEMAVEVDVMITNVSSHTIRIPMDLGGTERNFDVDITSPDGKIASETQYSKALRGAD